MQRKARFVRFSGENHELSRSSKPSHRLPRFGYFLDWRAEKLTVPAETVYQVAL